MSSDRHEEGFEETRPRPGPPPRSRDEERFEQEERGAKARRRREPDYDDRDDDYDRERPRRRRPHPEEGDALSTIIPYKNGMALTAYYLGVFSFICFIGLILTPLAIIFGILGLRAANQNPEAKGTGHAITGIVLGSLSLLIHVAVIAILATGALR